MESKGNKSENISTISGNEGQRPTYKVVILGDTDVGKSCFIKRYIENKFTENSDASVGAVFFSKKVVAKFDPKQANITIPGQQYNQQDEIKL